MIRLPNMRHQIFLFEGTVCDIYLKVSYYHPSNYTYLQIKYAIIGQISVK